LQNSPFLAGQFVWCAYPQRERPLTPGPRHVGYIVAMGKRPVGFGAMVAYTTTRRWSGATPLGVYAFSEAQARAMGQTKAFVLDLRRIAYIPVETRGFRTLPVRAVVASARRRRSTSWP
jgi:hypothetical protein